MISIVSLVFGFVVGYSFARLRSKKTTTVVTQIGGDNSKMTGIVNNFKE